MAVVAPRPAVHPDLAAFAAFALAHEDRAAHRVKVGLGERERFADSQAATPKDDDERTEPDPVCIITRCAHDRDDLLDRRRIGRIAQALYAGRDPGGRLRVWRAIDACLHGPAIMLVA